MGFDLGKLDEQIRKLQAIRDIVADPEAAALLQQMLTPNGAGASAAPVQVLAEQPRRAPRRKRVSQAQAVRGCVARLSGSFTVNDVAQALQADGITMSNLAVGKVLQRLLKRGQIRVVQRGEGFGSPNVYENATIAQ